MATEIGMQEREAVRLHRYLFFNEVAWGLLLLVLAFGVKTWWFVACAPLVVLGAKWTDWLADRMGW